MGRSGQPSRTQGPRRWLRGREDDQPQSKMVASQDLAILGIFEPQGSDGLPGSARRKCGLPHRSTRIPPARGRQDGRPERREGRAELSPGRCSKIIPSPSGESLPRPLPFAWGFPRVTSRLANVLFELVGRASWMTVRRFAGR